MKTYKKFNLNNYILVKITEYGWNELKKRSYGEGYINHCIMPRKKIINNEEWFELQTHEVISLFGDMVWATSPAPLEVMIMINEEDLE